MTFRELDEQEEDKTETGPMMSDLTVYTNATRYVLPILILSTHCSIHTIYTLKVEGVLKIEHLT